MDNFPEWLKTETTIKNFFMLLGFDVDNVSIEGRQIDIVANRTDRISGETSTYVIEVTLEKVGAQKGGVDSQKLMLAKTRYKNAHLILVSTTGFTDDQKATLEALGIQAKRLYELEATLLPLRKYAVSCKFELEHAVVHDVGYQASYYIEPELEIERGAALEKINSREWLNSILSAPTPHVCALLGSLGSGKTSFLKRILSEGLDRFLESPDLHPMPVYIPLGRYKQHAGDLDQMLMSEFRRSGIDIYPSAYINFLIKTRRIVLLLDGLDEVHPIQNSDDILETVVNIFSSIGGEACAIISCRRQFFQSSNEEQAYFGSYTADKLKDLNVGLQRALRGLPSSYIISVCPFDIPRIREYLAVRCGFSFDQTDDLLGQYYGFSDLASTPVLLAMIATTVSEGSLDVATPLRFPHVELYEAYTTRWIERDVGRAKLSAAQRLHFSESLADQMLWRAKDSIEWNEITQALQIDHEWGNNPLTTQEAEIDIRNSGFLIREVDDRWRFVHRSILEYFAARAELRRIMSNERPRYIPTDGYRLFFVELLARAWIEHGQCPIPAHAWVEARGDDVRANQWSLLASATQCLPDGAAVALSGVFNLSTNVSTSWRRVAFSRLKLSMNDGHIIFEQCQFSGCRLTFDNVDDNIIQLRECTFEDSELKFSNFPNWKSPYDANTSEAVDVSLATIELASAVGAGARVYIGGTQWLLKDDELAIFLECSRKLNRGKINKANFSKGVFAENLDEILPRLIQQELVYEDTSREGRQLSWTSQGRDLSTKLKNDPLSAQAAIAKMFTNS